MIVSALRGVTGYDLSATALATDVPPILADPSIVVTFFSGRFSALPSPRIALPLTHRRSKVPRRTGLKPHASTPHPHRRSLDRHIVIEYKLDVNIQIFSVMPGPSDRTR